MSALNFLQVNSTTLHYALAGQNQGTPLVFINSLGTDFRIWHGLIPYLAPSYRLIFYDKRGHGLSDCPPPPYTLTDHTADLSGLLEQLHLDSVVLVGDSVGGMIALDYAGRYRQRVKALILCDTAAKIGTTAYWNERIDTLRQHGLSYLAATILERWFSPAFAAQHPAAYRGYYNMLTRTPLEGYIATCEAIRDADLHDSVRLLNVKSLVLCGADDSATPPELVRSLAESLPNARFALIEQAGHIPSIEQPEVMAAKIIDFLSENGYD